MVAGADALDGRAVHVVQRAVYGSRRAPAGRPVLNPGLRGTVAAPLTAGPAQFTSGGYREVRLCLRVHVFFFFFFLNEHPKLNLIAAD